MLTHRPIAAQTDEIGTLPSLLEELLRFACSIATGTSRTAGMGGVMLSLVKTAVRPDVGMCRALVAWRDMAIDLLRFSGASSIAQARATLAVNPEHAAAIISVPFV
ncbi:MAG: hypothetical protein KatS3mg053_2439 [Candidatus Roseilinea sp.]|nr:MAG: hypothetical protein KatS3mg053_2439 [Candidatus Roseilinea sp.]